MLGQAAGFAFLAAISPTALLVMAVFLGSANPRQTALAYVAGAIVMSVAMAVTLLVVIRRRPRPPGSGSGIISRLIARPSAGSAFVAGVILFAPSATFIAAVQV